jgi:transposase, IS30 family
MPSGHLTPQEREVIGRMRYSGHGPTAIADALGRSKSTISRELRRNRSGGTYSALEAQRLAERRRRERPRSRKIDRPEINEAVRSGLAELWSPEQIAGRMRRAQPNNPGRQVSHETIYRWLRSDFEWAPHFRSFLREGGRRRKRRGRADGRGQIRDRISIEVRPPAVAARSRYGDWESDTMAGGGQRGHLVTHVERKSGYLLAARMNTRHAATLVRASRRLFADVPPELRLTMTVDNGKEFAAHERLTRHLGMPVYFAHPYSSWERGTNENTNGLLRQYFPKGTRFLDVSHRELAYVTAQLNNRPRKRLDYQTPAEVLAKARPVALQT